MELVQLSLTFLALTSTTLFGAANANKFSIVCGQHLNFTENDGCFFETSDNLYIKFLNHYGVAIGKLRNGSLTIKSSNPLIHNIPRISYNLEQNQCIINFEPIQNDSKITCGKIKCSVHNTGCKKDISQVIQLEVISAKHMNIISVVPESLSKVLPYLHKFKEYSVKSSKLLIILYAITAFAITMTIVIRLSKTIAKEQRQKPLLNPTDHEKEIVTYSDCICLEKDIPPIPSSLNKYFSLEPLQRTVSYP